jgi:hypothetical protein
MAVYRLDPSGPRSGRGMPDPTRDDGDSVSALVGVDGGSDRGSNHSRRAAAGRLRPAGRPAPVRSRCGAMGLAPTTPCLQTVWTEGLGELSWAPTRTERPGATSMVRVVWHVRGTAAPLDHRGGAGGVREPSWSAQVLAATPGSYLRDRQLGNRTRRRLDTLDAGRLGLLTGLGLPGSASPCGPCVARRHDFRGSHCDGRPLAGSVESGRLDASATGRGRYDAAPGAGADAA